MRESTTGTASKARSLTPFHRFLLFAGIGSAIIAVHLAIYWPLLGQKLDDPVAKPGPGYEKTDIDERIEEEQINPLRAETLRQSLAKLSDVQMFFWPGAIRESLSGRHRTLPLASTVGGWDVQPIMSNRRFLKVYDDLSMLPKRKAAELINREIEEGLPIYFKLFAEDLEVKKDSIKADAPWQTLSTGVQVRSVGGYQINNNEDGTPTVLGMRYKLLTLALIAGNLGVEESRPVLAKLARQGSQSYQRLQRKDLYNHDSAYAIIDRGSLYNRQILGTALLGTSAKLGGLTAGAAKYRVSTMSEDLPHYGVRATRFDLHGRAGVVPVDLSNGKLTVRFLGDISDLTFEEILAFVEAEDRQK